MNVSESIDWQTLDVNELLGHRFIAYDRDGQTIDGFLHPVQYRQTYVELGLRKQKVPVIRIPTPRYAGPSHRYPHPEEPSIIEPFTAVNVLEETE